VVAVGQGLRRLAAAGAPGRERREQGEAERPADLLRCVEYSGHQAGVGVGGAGHAQRGHGRQGEPAAESEQQEQRQQERRVSGAGWDLSEHRQRRRNHHQPADQDLAATEPADQARRQAE